jgi:hypothetical protein
VAAEYLPSPDILDVLVEQFSDLIKRARADKLEYADHLRLGVISRELLSLWRDP